MAASSRTRYAPPQRIEHQRKRRMRLSAVLRTKAEQHDLSLTIRRRDRRRFACETAGAFDPAGEEHVFLVVGIGREDPALDVGGGRGGFEGDRFVLEGGYFARHAGSYGMVGADFESHE